VRWHVSHRYDPRALPLANRHYNRHNADSPQFVPPGSPVVLLTEKADALWVSLRQKFQSHAWPGAWMNTLFRNESDQLSSELITEAVAATLHAWGEPPAMGFISFVDSKKTKKKRDPGRCYRRAGWKHVGFTIDAGLYVFQLLPSEMPAVAAAHGAAMSLFA
jgi:hypothetical protein